MPPSRDKHTSESQSSPPSSPPSSDTSLAGNSSTVPSASAANKPKAGSSAKNPEANTTAEPPPSPDKGATKSAIEAPPAGAIPVQHNLLLELQHSQRMSHMISLVQALHHLLIHLLQASVEP